MLPMKTRDPQVYDLDLKFKGFYHKNPVRCNMYLILDDAIFFLEKIMVWW